MDSKLSHAGYYCQAQSGYLFACLSQNGFPGGLRAYGAENEKEADGHDPGQAINALQDLVDAPVKALYFVRGHVCRQS